MFGPRADCGWYRTRKPLPTKRVWFRDHETGKPGLIEAADRTIPQAIKEVRALGYSTVLVEVK